MRGGVCDGRPRIGHDHLTARRRHRAGRICGVRLCARVPDGRSEIKACLCIHGLGHVACVRSLVALDRRRIRFRIVGNQRLRHHLLCHQQRMREVGRCDRAGRDDDARAHPGPGPHLHGKRRWHADAAVRRRIARQHTGVQGDARPGEALHVRHRRAAIDVGAVHLVLLNDAEHAHRGRMPLHSCRDRAFGEQTVAVVDAHLLLLDRDGNDQRPVRLGAGVLARGLVLGGRLAGLWLARLWCKHRPVIAGIVILPVEQRGIRLRREGDGAGARQDRGLPKTPAWKVCARDTRTEKTLPAHAHIPNSRFSFVVADEKRVHQRRPYNFSAFRPDRSKKASHSVKSRLLNLAPSMWRYCGLPAFLRRFLSLHRRGVLQRRNQ